MSDPRRPAEVVRDFATRIRIAEAETFEAPSFLAGTASQITEDLRRQRARWGFSHVGFQKEDHVTLAPVVEELAGI